MERFVIAALLVAIGVAVALVLERRRPAPPTQSRWAVPTQLDRDDFADRGAVPWLAMLNFAPFKKLLLMVLVWAAAYGGMQAFAVVYLKEAAAMSEAKVLLVNSIFFLGGFCSLWFLGSRLDGLGSKPVLTFSFAIWLLVQAGWTMLAGGALTAGLALVIGLQFLMGLFAALVQMSNTRLVMAIAPVMGRNHFFALFSVVLSVTQGLAPIAWGILIDALGPRRAGWAGLDWNNFTIFFAAVGAVLVVALVLARRLEEPEAASLDKLLREILVDSPQRVLVRLWQKE